jgi:hypothetical protein
MFAVGTSFAGWSIMTDPVSSANIDVRYECLDMFPIKWASEGIEKQCPDGGILLEIWKTGGIVQTSVAIPTGAWVELAPKGRHTIQAQVTCCEQDDYGFLVSISLNQSQYENCVVDPIYWTKNDPFLR